ncbi:MAG: hypothetical protein LUP97_08985 [Methanoregula sp.]|nr:hypothetical protein [Methanoregula sp.]
MPVVNKYDCRNGIAKNGRKNFADGACYELLPARAVVAFLAVLIIGIVFVKPATGA